MKRFGLTLSLVVVLFLPATASADFALHPLAGASGAVMSGATSMVATASGLTIDATVDYWVGTSAAWTAQSPWPGAFFPLASSPGAGYGPGDYIYAYQIYNNGSTTTPPHGTSTTPFSTLSISTVAGATITDTGEDHLFDPGPPARPNGTSPTDGVVYSTSLDFEFFTASGLALETWSSILLFASPNAPMMGSGSILDTGVAANGSLPTPIPVPGAALLGAVGLGIITRIRRSFG